MSAVPADQWRAKAQVARQAGDVAGALAILEQGVAALPADAALANSAGHAAMGMKDFEKAAHQFASAVQLAPDVLEFTINYAIALTSMERYRDAAAALEPFAREGQNVARYCSVRATAERGLHNLAEAAHWYDRCIDLEPGHPRALHGRARLALERGEPSAASRYEQALAVTNGDPELWLGRAQALDAAGEVNAARDIAEQLFEQAPHWLEGLQFLAQLRLAAGEADFASHYETAMGRAPQDPAIPAELCAVLAGRDRNKDAAAIAQRARTRFPNDQQFALLEAVYASASGEVERAETLWNSLLVESREDRLHLARHRLRRSEFDRAEILLDSVLEEDPMSVSAWALRSVLWRLTGDQREEWLHHQQGLVAFLQLHDADKILPSAIAKLHQIHDASAQPLGQSLRGGTQSRALLFDRTEPEFSALRGAILSTIEEHRAAMPHRDPTHPILRHRDTPWEIAGSWSVRLTGGGDKHASHIHPLGMISSALYCECPQAESAAADADPRAGWLELGRPPEDLGIGLEPIAAFPPRAGYLALFPSTLYHGTRPFPDGRRMTVAFDVTPVREAV